MHDKRSHGLRRGGAALSMVRIILIGELLAYFANYASGADAGMRFLLVAAATAIQQVW
jgi:hypothetical protein